MNFGGILAKLLRKPNAQNTAPDGWGGWLDTPEGKRWEATGEKVYDALATAKVNIHERRILVRDGAKLKKLTLNQVTRCVAEETGEEVEAVRGHVIMWLEDAGETDDEERDGDMEIPDAIQSWTYEIRHSDLALR